MFLGIPIIFERWKIFFFQLCTRILFTDYLEMSKCVSLLQRIFEFSKTAIENFIRLQVMKFQNIFLANIQKSYLIFEAGFKN